MAPVHRQANRESDLDRMDNEGGWHETQVAGDEDEATTRESGPRPKRRRTDDREPPLTGGYGYGFGYGYDRDNMIGGEVAGYGEGGSEPMRRTGRKRERDRDAVRRSRAKRERES